jgi:hypothetical protein
MAERHRKRERNYKRSVLKRLGSLVKLESKRLTVPRLLELCESVEDKSKRELLVFVTSAHTNPPHAFDQLLKAATCSSGLSKTTRPSTI